MAKRIGEYLIERGLLAPDKVEEILRYSSITGLRFGDAAVALGFLSHEALVAAFGPHHATDFFNLDPRSLPPATRGLLLPERMAELGGLPLGFKGASRMFRRELVLNVGLLDPSREPSRAAIEEAAARAFGRGHFARTQVFLVLADQLLDALRLSYGMDEMSLRRIARSGTMDPTLAAYLATHEVGPVLRRRAA